MPTDFNKNEFSQNYNKSKHHQDVLVGKFCRLRYVPWNKNYYNQKSELENLKQYSNLRVKKEIHDFDKAKERMKQKMIASDKSKDNTVLYTAMTQFKKE